MVSLVLMVLNGKFIDRAEEVNVPLVKFVDEW
jgi:hypothetical protein